MKKLIITALLFSSVAFAQPLIPQPKCIKGQLAYLDQQHVVFDFCITHLKAVSPQHCNQVFAALGQKRIQEKYKIFIKNRQKEICKGK